MTNTTPILVGLFLLIISCTSNNNIPSTEKQLTKEHFVGETMGTTFSIAYLDSTGLDLSIDVENLLLKINNSVSTYQKNSEISRFNQGDSLTVDSEGHFARNYNLAKEIYKKSTGWFNPTVMPLVNYWGFGYTKQALVKDVDPVELKKRLALVQFDSIRLENVGNHYLLIKQKKGIELDFSAIAKGDAVDEVGRLLEANGILNYFVEIGGEVRARGVTIGGATWRTGIRRPKENSATNEAQVAVELNNLSLATSGNYENYHEDKTTGQKYAHTINPHTGYPEKNSLLSASVFAKDCATADAFATAFMAMGLEKAFALAQELPELEVYFIYSDAQGNLKEKYTDKVKEFMLK